MKRDARSLSLLTAEQFHRVSRAISDRTRYDILCKVFASSGLTCGGAAEGLPISAATASHHIRKLFNAGLVDVTKQGRHRIVVPRQRSWKAYLALLEGFSPLALPERQWEIRGSRTNMASRRAQGDVRKPYRPLSPRDATKGTY